MTLTPKQFSLLATKEDINETKADVRELKEESGIIKQNIDKVMDVLDHLVKMFKDSEEEKVSNLAAHDRFEESIVDLKGRVRVLER